MNKNDFLLELAYSNVPKGAKKVTREIGHGLVITKMDAGARAIKQAEIFHSVLVRGLSDLPEEVTTEHHERVAVVIRDFFNFGDQGEEAPVPWGVRALIASDRDKFLAKLGELLRQTGI
jgi:hypothetical protein